MRAGRSDTMSSETVTGFTAVDRSKDPEFFARFLDGANRQTSIGACKQIVLDALRCGTAAVRSTSVAAWATIRRTCPAKSHARTTRASSRASRRISGGPFIVSGTRA
jgi:hypothetical protein